MSGGLRLGHLQSSRAGVLARSEDDGLNASLEPQHDVRGAIAERDESLPSNSSAGHEATTNFCVVSCLTRPLDFADTSSSQEAELLHIRSMLNRLADQASVQAQPRDDTEDSSANAAVADTPTAASRIQDGRSRPTVVVHIHAKGGSRVVLEML